MKGAAVKLTDTIIRKAKPDEAKPYKLVDGAGLHLQVTPAGGKLWRYRYEITVGDQRKERLLALGAYPAVSLADARKAREEAQAQLRQGKDPSAEKRSRRAQVATEAANTFRPIAETWFERQRPLWSETHVRDVRRNLDRDVLPVVGDLPIRSITPRMILLLVREVEKRSLATARKVRQQISAVFMHAVAEHLAETDPSQGIAKAMAALPLERHHPAVVSLQAMQEMLRRSESLPAYPSTRLALRFFALTVVRSKELRLAMPDEMHDLDGPAPIWIIPKERMKGRRGKRREHRVPLCPEAVAVVRAALAFTGGRFYVFPGSLSMRKPISETAVNKLLRRSGYRGEHTTHGFRSSFSTIMNERHAESDQDRAIIDLMLAHLPPGRVEAVHNRAAYMARRRELACEWGALVMEGLPPPADLIRLPRSGPSDAEPESG